jgi:pimeloyl-ACP methyl ester carboxylesterase
MTNMLHISHAGLTFEAYDDGAPNAPLVLLLHGFPQTHHTWHQQLPALAAAGYYAVAPNQRGYSPGARPEGVAEYATRHLVGDVLGIADQLGAPRFHLVGHDWGGQVSWLVAAYHPERLHSLTVLSRPHPAAFAETLQVDPAQAERSQHHRAFQDPRAADRLLENSAERLRQRLAAEGVPEADITAYLTPLATREAMDAAINWYRAGAGDGSVLARADVPKVSVPTLYLWGEQDSSVGYQAATRTAQYVTGPYRFEPLKGLGHFLTDQHPERVTAHLLEHIRHHS